MKIIAAYNIFNGLEIFHQSVRNTLPFVDQVIFVYQTLSYRGNENEEVLKHIHQYPDILAYRFTPNMNLLPKDNELNKQNFMMQLCKDHGADYMLLMDCDHIYQPDKFQSAINIAVQYDVSFTRMMTYYKYPTWQLDPPEDYYMPFLIKLYPHTQFVKNVKFYPVLVDPTLRVNTFMLNHVFDINDFHFHHYSMVRDDINEKFRNSPSRPYEYWKQGGFVDEWENYDINVNPGVKYFSGRKIRIVKNYFDI